MKNSNTAERLKSIMSERNLKQVDIVAMCKPYCERYGVKMNKSDLSQYVAGKSEPSQDKLVVLAMALGVQESWLMGFDVPAKKEKPVSIDELNLSDSKRELLIFAESVPEEKAARVLQAMKLFLED